MRRRLASCEVVCAATVVVAMIFATPAHAQLAVRGTANSSVYAQENPAGDQLWDLYQGLRFRAWSVQNPDVQLRAHMRVTRRGEPADWDGRLYRAYLGWRPNRTVELRLGRQFLYDGVINGTADALLVELSPATDVDLNVVGGLEAPRLRDFDVGSFDDGYVLGGSVSWRTSAKIDLSYFQRVRSDALVWQVAGAGISGELSPGLFYNGVFDYNFQTSDYQRIRMRLGYRTGAWLLNGEFQSQKPQVLEDSFFNRFSLSTYTQARGGVYYQFGRYTVGVHDQVTFYEEGETGNEVFASLSARWGSVGVVYQSGFGGEKIGLYGEARYELVSGLEARASSSHYNFQRYTADFDEDATSFSAGLRYRPVRGLFLDAEVQESLNSLYDNDLRALFRVSYAFSTI